MIGPAGPPGKPGDVGPKGKRETSAIDIVEVQYFELSTASHSRLIS